MARNDSLTGGIRQTVAVGGNNRTGETTRIGLGAQTSGRTGRGRGGQGVQTLTEFTEANRGGVTRSGNADIIGTGGDLGGGNLTQR